MKAAALLRNMFRRRHTAESGDAVRRAEALGRRIREERRDARAAATARGFRNRGDRGF